MKTTILATVLFAALSTVAQRPFVTMAPSFTNTYLGLELQGGIRTGSVTGAVGYNAVINSAQPSLFYVRGGFVIKERWHVYGGPVHVLHSVDYKARNYNTWQAGAAYHFSFYDRGSFMVSASYTPGYPSAGIGMSYNLFK